MATNKKRSPRLGRGLSSLMSSPVQVQPPAEKLDQEEALGADQAVVGRIQGEVGAGGSDSNDASQAAEAKVPGVSRPAPPTPTQEQAGLTYLSVDVLRPNRHQPRQRFDEASLKRLADSIASEGIMQPIVARPCDDGVGRYEVVAGERRWRAAQLAGLATMPVIVRDLNDRQIAEWALIENLQREDLNPIERAEAFSRLIEQFGLSHEEAGDRVGMDRSSISNHLRLLGLCDPVKQLIGEGLISMGQARAMVGLSDVEQQRMLAERAVRQGMSVREVEAEVRKLSSGGSLTVKSSRPIKASFLADLEQQIAEQLGTKVFIRAGRKKGSGTLSIEFYSLDQFDSLVNRLGVETN
jgi:ParB family transcriptional regulator, chromosome partitioning protein